VNFAVYNSSIDNYIVEDVQKKENSGENEDKGKREEKSAKLTEKEILNAIL